VEAVKELPLKGPFKLRMVQVPRMKLEIICMNGDISILELDDDLDRLALPACREIQQRVLVEAQLG